jgi:hypothetical protein
MKKLIFLLPVLLFSCGVKYDTLVKTHHIVSKEMVNVNGIDQCRVILDSGDTVLLPKCPKSDTVNYFFYTKKK